MIILNAWQYIVWNSNSKLKFSSDQIFLFILVIGDIYSIYYLYDMTSVRAKGSGRGIPPLKNENPPLNLAGWGVNPPLKK